MLSLPLLVALVFSLHVRNDGFITIRLLKFGSDATDVGADFTVILLFASGSGASTLSFHRQSSFVVSFKFCVSVEHRQTARHSGVYLAKECERWAQECQVVGVVTVARRQSKSAMMT